MVRIPRVLRAKGHALTLEWSGERGVESSSTGVCHCGWTESASSQDEVRNEYRFHLMRVLGISVDEVSP
jgi:predicted small metal-binding protein